MVLSPVLPMEPKAAARPFADPDWIAQIKWDGVRILTYWDGETRLINRRLHERTLQYPEIADASRFIRARSAILDGEVIAFDRGPDGVPVPSFHQVMKRDSIRHPDKVPLAARQVPVMYMVFDLLYLDGEWICDLPLHQRQERLAAILVPTEHVQLVESTADGVTLYEAVRTRGLEGIVLKDTSSPYRMGVKSDRWLKVKNYRDLAAVIGGFTVREGLANAFLLGQYDERGALRYIGHCGTGRISKGEWAALAARLSEKRVTQPLFADPLPVRAAVWVEPAVTVRVQYMGWTTDCRLWQPSIQAVLDLPPSACRLADERPNQP